MSILKNAVDSIELGIEDFRTNNPKRLISAVRNIFAGVLLLFKHKLAELSQGNDEALLKQKVLPEMVNGEIRWSGQGKKTVDVLQIQERFKSLGIQVDWKRLEKIQNYRNDIEHYFDTNRMRPEVVRQYVLNCFNVACDFMRSELKIEPKDHVGCDIWKSWMEEQEIYDSVAKSCSELWEQVSWTNNLAEKHVRNFLCSECSSDLIRPIMPINDDIEGMSFQCVVCDKTWKYFDLLILACKQEERRNYYDPHDYDISQFFECPECYLETYDAHEDQCANCGAKGPYICPGCDNSIPPDELSFADGKLCSRCYNLMSKDD